MFLTRVGEGWQVQFTATELDIVIRSWDFEKSNLNDEEWDRLDKMHREMFGIRKRLTDPRAPQKETTKDNVVIEQRECLDCCNTFSITQGMKDYFVKAGYELPRRCKECREERKAQRATSGGK